MPLNRSGVPSTLTPLFENWRRRIRGNERRFLAPFSYVVVEAAPVDEVDEAEVELQPVHRAERTGELERQDEDDPTVLRFPSESRVTMPPEPSPPARPSGPLSWAYWAARHQ